MAHRRPAYNRLAAPAIRTKSRQQCASESGEVLEIRNRLSFKDHAVVNHEHSVSLDRLHRVRKLDSVSVRLLHVARPASKKGSRRDRGISSRRDSWGGTRYPADSNLFLSLMFSHVGESREMLSFEESKGAGHLFCSP